MFTRIIAAATLAAIAPLTVVATPAAAQTSAADARFRAAQERFDREYQIYRQEADRYQAVRSSYNDPRAYQNSDPRYAPRVADPRYADTGYDDDAYYDPRTDYRAGSQYRERVLSNDERVYAGTDGRYYCKRNDGTTGLIVGGAAGGILGNVIDGGRSRVVGTLLGGAAGALAGKSIDQNSGTSIRCR